MRGIVAALCCRLMAKRSRAFEPRCRPPNLSFAQPPAWLPAVHFSDKAGHEQRVEVDRGKRRRITAASTIVDNTRMSTFQAAGGRMTQSSARNAKVRWSISVPLDFDESVRLYLASQGGGKGSLSLLVQKAVSRCILSSLSREAKEKVRASGLSQSELDEIIADGLAWAKDHPR